MSVSVTDRIVVVGDAPEDLIQVGATACGREFTIAIANCRDDRSVLVVIVAP